MYTFASDSRLALALAVLCGACQLSKFDDYAKHAPIRVEAAPAHYGMAGYGRVLATAHGQVDVGQQGSRIVASAGGASPIVFTRAWNGRSVSERSFQRCRDNGECRFGRDVGATLIPFETWGAGLAEPRYGCVYAPSNAVSFDAAGAVAVAGGEAYVVCESNKNPQNFSMGLQAVQGEEASLEFSGFGLPAGHPLGVVVVGIHALDNRSGERRNGALYRQLDRTNDAAGGVPPQLIPLRDPSTGQAFSDDPAAADFGRQVAGAFLASGALWVAIAQPARQRVIVASYDPAAPGDELAKWQTRACIEASDPSLRGFGERLVFGDVTGDGAPELFVGVDPIGGVEPGRTALFLYDGTGMPPPAPDATQCPPWAAAARQVDCREPAGGPSCADAAFGAALAVGDVDGDGRGDLIAGAPRAAVDGVPEAGAVWVLAGASDGLDANRFAVLTSDPSAGAQLGSAVGALHTEGRDEPVASAPGRDEIDTFMCTALEAGFGGATLCLP